MNQVTVYCFVSPFPTQETTHIINSAFQSVGKVKITDPVKGYVLCRYKVSAFRTIKVEFFVERSDTVCKVRAVIHGEVINRARDKWWDNYLSSTFSLYPNVDFGVSLANKHPLVCGVLFLGGETEQVFTSYTTGGTSLTGFLVGGALFGGTGAIVGGLSGTQHTYGKSREQFADTQLMRIIYNNGRIWEGRVEKNSSMYQEIMVNMH
ncbi:MAG: hypothetical protein J1E34_03700 [Oscillospiraceae bacterium]|nr:hypothetical protein [Oscillospiraceae bacterium]